VARVTAMNQLRDQTAAECGLSKKSDMTLFLLCQQKKAFDEARRELNLPPDTPPEIVLARRHLRGLSQ
jgi:hypothetical protein